MVLELNFSIFSYGYPQQKVGISQDFSRSKNPQDRGGGGRLHRTAPPSKENGVKFIYVMCTAHVRKVFISCLR